VHLKIDGSIHEGGGSILRVAVPIAAALGNSIEVTNIRANRKKPGLRLQHLLGLQIIRDITRGELTGGEVGSQQITFTPLDHIQIPLNVKVETAASIPLIIQTLLNYVVAGGYPIDITFEGGGTHTRWAPTMEYLEHVTAPTLRLFGITLEMVVKKFGFYPRGGASVRVSLSKLEPNSPVVIKERMADDDRPRLYVCVSKSLESKRIPERIHEIVSKKLEVDLLPLYKEGFPGVAATLVLPGLPSLGYSVIGERKLSSETLGKMLLEQVTDDTNHMDEYLSDQLLVALAFSPLGSELIVHNTPHVLANLHVIENTLGNVLSVEEEGAFLRIYKIQDKK